MAVLPSLEEERRLLEAVVREAADEALKHFRTDVKRWSKGDHSPVSEADLAVDAALRAALMGARPEHGWVSEESDSGGSRSGRTYIVDPIDGTRAFLDGQTGWSLSVALVEAGRPVAAAIYRPAKDEMFAASRGGGAYRDGVRLCIDERALAGAAVGVRRAVFDAAALGEAGAVRGHYVPSLALRLAYVATGRLDAVVTKPGAHHWDLAAADLVLCEAGGLLTNLAGGRPDYAARVSRHGAVVAGPPLLAEQLAARVAHYSEQTAGLP